MNEKISTFWDKVASSMAWQPGDVDDSNKPSETSPADASRAAGYFSLEENVGNVSLDSNPPTNGSSTAPSLNVSFNVMRLPISMAPRQHSADQPPSEAERMSVETADGSSLNAIHSFKSEKDKEVTAAEKVMPLGRSLKFDRGERSKPKIGTSILSGLSKSHRRAASLIVPTFGNTATGAPFPADGIFGTKGFRSEVKSVFKSTVRLDAFLEKQGVDSLKKSADSMSDSGGHRKHGSNTRTRMPNIHDSSELHFELKRKAQAATVWCFEVQVSKRLFTKNDAFQLFKLAVLEIDMVTRFFKFFELDDFTNNRKKTTHIYACSNIGKIDRVEGQLTVLKLRLNERPRMICFRSSEALEVFVTKTYELNRMESMNQANMKIVTFNCAGSLPSLNDLNIMFPTAVMAAEMAREQSASASPDILFVNRTKSKSRNVSVKDTTSPRRRKTDDLGEFCEFDGAAESTNASFPSFGAIPTSGTEVPYDFYVLGLQECSVEAMRALSAVSDNIYEHMKGGVGMGSPGVASYVSNQNPSTKPKADGDRSSGAPNINPAALAKKWTSNLVEIFPEALFTCIIHKFSWDRCLIVFARNRISRFVSKVTVDTLQLGAANLVGNKGVILLQFRFKDTVFRIVNCHFAAHAGFVEQRNNNFSLVSKFIQTNFLFPNKIAHHEIFMGDFNYRVDLPGEKCKELIEAKNWSEILRHDELIQQIAQDKAFPEAKEGLIEFPPTFKFVPNTDTYFDEKQRVPSYCDRILFQSLPGLSSLALEYDSLPEIMFSDHRPVTAVLQFQLIDNLLPVGSRRNLLTHEEYILTFPSLILSLASTIPDPSSGSKRSPISLTLTAAEALNLERSQLYLTFKCSLFRGEGFRSKVASLSRLAHNIDFTKAVSPIALLTGQLGYQRISSEYVHIWVHQRSSTWLGGKPGTHAVENARNIDAVDSENESHMPAASQSSATNIVGYAVLWLGLILSRDSDQPTVPFSLPILRNSVQIGTMSGEFEVSEPETKPFAIHSVTSP